MSRERVLTDVQWERVAPLMPSSDGVKSRPFRDHRQVVEGVIYRFRTGLAWRDLPPAFGPWQTVWKWHHRFATDGTWDKIHARLLAEADAADDIDWMVSVDSTITRATSTPPTPPGSGSPRVTLVPHGRLAPRAGWHPT